MLEQKYLTTEWGKGGVCHIVVFLPIKWFKEYDEMICSKCMRITAVQVLNADFSHYGGQI